ncbi:MAG: TonB-dependent receptor, partial [Bacteroidetes bacterium]
MNTLPFPYYLLVFLLLGLSPVIQAQEVSLRGQVTDQATGEPLPGAAISVPALRAGTYAGEDGRYELRLTLRDQPVEVRVSYSGYTAKSFTLAPGAATETRDIALVEEGFTTEDVVITATKGFEQAQSDVTVSIEVVKPSFIDLQAVPSVDKVISQIPGVDNQGGQINIRGSSGYAYGVGSRVMVTLDGLPLLTGDAGTANLDLIPVDNIAQIEVMKGASSVLYGSSALGGVISIITADPGEKPLTSVRLRGGIFGQPANPALDWDGDATPWSASAHVFHSRRIGPLALAFQTNFIKESGYRQGTDAEISRSLLMLKYRPTSLPGLTLGLNASVNVDSSGSILYWHSYYPGEVVSISNDTTISKGALTPTPDAGGFRRQLNTDVALDPSIKYLTPNGSLFWYRGRYLRNFNQNNTNQSSDNSIFYNDFLYQTTLAGKVNWVTGVTYTRSSIVGDSLYGGTYVYEGDTISSSGNHAGYSLGAYTQLDAKFGRLNASLGFRYERVQIDETIREEAPVFRAGLNYKIAQGTNIRASFG